MYLSEKQDPVHVVQAERVLIQGSMCSQTVERAGGGGGGRSQAPCQIQGHWEVTPSATTANPELRAAGAACSSGAGDSQGKNQKWLQNPTSAKTSASAPDCQRENIA